MKEIKYKKDEEKELIVFSILGGTKPKIIKLVFLNTFFVPTPTHRENNQKTD
jgi:hypothetical protein